MVIWRSALELADLVGDGLAGVGDFLALIEAGAVVTGRGDGLLAVEDVVEGFVGRQRIGGDVVGP